MILQALVGYYDRMLGNKDEAIPKVNFGKEYIDYEIILNKEGELVQIEDIRSTDGKRIERRYAEVPKVFQGKKGNGIKPNFLWEDASYVFGADKEAVTERSLKKFEAFKKLHHEIGDKIDDPLMQAILKFLDNWEPENSLSLENWKDIASSRFIFKLDGIREHAHENGNILRRFSDYMESKGDGEEDSQFIGTCLVTGRENVPIARLHQGIKGIEMSQHAQNVLIGFQKQKTAFCSYGKDGLQGLNSPVSETSAMKYGIALNYLINTKRQKLLLGNTTTVFWAEKDDDMENALPWAVSYNRQPGELEEASDLELERFLKAMKAGKTPSNMNFNDEVKFYILGLVPNAIRLSIRFWFPTTVGKLRENLKKHLEDVSIEGPKDYPPSIWVIINETLKKKGDEDTGRMKVLEKMESSPVKKLAGDLVRSIITSANYPNGLLSSMLERIRKDSVVTFPRVSMIKGFLARNFKGYLEEKNINKEALVSLNENCREVGYVLGRLFAAYEKAQLYYHWKESGRRPNRTIKDSYYSLALTNPLVAFTKLERLAKVYLTKAGWVKPRIEAIENLLDAKPYPTTFNLAQQSLFILGYYHQSRELRPESQEEDIQSKSKTETTEN